MSRKTNKKKDLINDIKKKLSYFKDLTYDSKKKLYFLFGSGINFHLANNAYDWDDFAKEAMRIKMLDHYKDDYVASAVARSVIKELANNKLALLFTNKEIKFNWIKLDESKDFYRIFNNSVNAIRRRFTTYFITLNYDNLLEKALDFPGGNALEIKDIKNPEENFIYHLHGKINEGNNTISEKSLFNLQDYVNNYEVAKEKLEQILQVQENEEWRRLVVIFGTNLTDEHIIAAFKKMKKINDGNDSNDSIEIIYFQHGTGCLLVDDKIKNVYSRELGIKLINFRLSNNISDDFIFAWKEFVKILTGAPDKNALNISGEEISLGKLAESIKKPLTYSKIKINKNFQLLSIDRKKVFLATFLNPRNYSNEYIKALIDNLKFYSISTYFNWSSVKIGIIRKLITKVNDKYLKDKNNLINQYDEFLKFILRGIKELKQGDYIKKYKRNAPLMNWIFFYQISSLWKNDFTYQNIINSQNINWNISGLKTMWITSIPGKNKFLIDILNKDIEKIPFLKRYKTFSFENLKSFIKSIEAISWFFNVLFTSNWREKWNEIIIFIEKQFNDDKLTIQKKIRYFLIYYLLLVEMKQIKKLKEKASEFQWINKYPDTSCYMGTASSFIPKISELDDTMIEKNKNAKYFKNLNEASITIKREKPNSIFDKEKFIVRMLKIKFPNTMKERIKFITTFNTIWKQLFDITLLFRGHPFGGKYHIEISDIDNFIELQKIINNEKEKAFLHDFYPIKLNINEKIKNAFIEKIKKENNANLKSSDENIYKLYFLQSHNAIFAGLFMIRTWWFKMLKDLNNDHYRSEIKNDLQNKYNLNEEQIMCLLNKKPQWFKPKNWDDIYILMSRFKMDEFRNKISPPQLAKIIWKPYKITNLVNGNIIIREYFYVKLKSEDSDSLVIEVIKDINLVESTYKETNNIQLNKLYKSFKNITQKMVIYLAIMKLSYKALEENQKIIKISRSYLLNMLKDFSNDELFKYDLNLKWVYENVKYKDQQTLLDKAWSLKDKIFGPKFKEIIKERIIRVVNINDKNKYFDKKNIKKLIATNNIVFEKAKEKQILKWLDE